MVFFAAIVTFPIALILCVVFYFTGDLGLLSFTMAWLQTFATVYCALWLLSRRDQLQRQAALCRIRRELQGESNSTDEEFLSPESEHPQILIELRHAIALILDIPPQRILRHAPFITDIRKHHLELWFVGSLLSSVLSSKTLTNDTISFPPDSIETIDQLSNWVYATYLGPDTR